MKPQAIHWPTVLVSVAASGGLFLLCSGLLALFLLPRYSLQLDLSEQDLGITLPSSLPVQVTVNEPIDARIDGAVQTRVPINQKLPMRIDERLQLNVQMDADVPMNFDVIINDRVKVDSEIRTTVLGIPMTLPIKGELPLNMVVPINQTVPIKFDAPLTADIREAFEIYLNTEINTAIEVHENFAIPVLEALNTEIHLPQDRPIAVRVESDTLALPLNRLRLKRQDRTQSDSP